MAHPLLEFNPDEVEVASHALAILGRLNYFGLLAKHAQLVSLMATEAETDELVIGRKIREAHAIKQYLTQMQSEAFVLGQNIDSDSGDF